MNITNPTPSEMAEAADAVEHYKEVLKRGKSYSPAEDQLMLAMYKQIASGRQVVNAFDLLTEGGVDDRKRPCLFLARAGWKQVRWRRMWHGCGIFFNHQADSRSKHRKDNCISVPERTWEDWQAGYDEHWSVVPSIPPLLRPRGRLDGYVILSEATWQAVPKDPALLRPIKWPLCAVLAVWDLTELERKVLGITRIGG